MYCKGYKGSIIKGGGGGKCNFLEFHIICECLFCWSRRGISDTNCAVVFLTCPLRHPLANRLLSNSCLLAAYRAYMCTNRVRRSEHCDSQLYNATTTIYINTYTLTHINHSILYRTVPFIRSTPGMEFPLVAVAPGVNLPEICPRLNSNRGFLNQADRHQETLFFSTLNKRSHTILQYLIYTYIYMCGFNCNRPTK